MYLLMLACVCLWFSFETASCMYCTQDLRTRSEVLDSGLFVWDESFSPSGLRLAQIGS